MYELINRHFVDKLFGGGGAEPLRKNMLSIGINARGEYKI